MLKLVCGLAAAALAFAPRSAIFADDAAQIKKLIPAATSIAPADCDKLGKGRITKPSDFAEPSLTAILLTLRPQKDVSKEASEAFDSVDSDAAIHPVAILREMDRRQDKSDKGDDVGIVTLVHADRIIDFTCSPAGEIATGTVSWKTPELKGKFVYVAQRKNGEWQITEIRLKGRGITLTRNQQGKWEQK